MESVLIGSTTRTSCFISQVQSYGFSDTMVDFLQLRFGSYDAKPRARMTIC